jgi:hypothetical protein
MVHPLVSQLHFARSEFVRCLKGVPHKDAIKRIEPLNCLSWIVGHLAAQEQYLWLEHGLGRVLENDLRKIVGFGQPASTPDWEEMWTRWREITAAADEFLASVSDETLDDSFSHQTSRLTETVGILILRNIYHYWHHLGEAHAIRQILGHRDLPVFVGGMQEVRLK